MAGEAGPAPLSPRQGSLRRRPDFQMRIVRMSGARFQCVFVRRVKPNARRVSPPGGRSRFRP